MQRQLKELNKVLEKNLVPKPVKQKIGPIFKKFIILILLIIIPFILILAISPLNKFLRREIIISVQSPIINLGQQLNLSSSSSLQNKERINLLLLGIPGQGYHGEKLTDTIIIINSTLKAENPIGISIPRDLLVKFPSKDYYTKINSLYNSEEDQKKGIELIKTSLKEITDLDIDYFVVFDLDGVKNLIEQLDAQVSNTIQTLTRPLNSIEDALSLVTEMLQTEISPVKFRTHPRAQELEDAFHIATENLNNFKRTVPEEDKGAVQYKDFSNLLGALELTNSLSVFKGAVQFKASSRLFYENQVDLFGAESMDINRRAVDLFKKSEAAERRIEELTEEARIGFESTPDGQERERVRQEIIEHGENMTENEKTKLEERFVALLDAEKQFIQSSLENNPEYQMLPSLIAEAEYAVEDTREAAVYEKIETFLKKYPDYGDGGMKCAVVEYGAKHTFAESAEAWNVQPDVKVSFGVIEIKESEGSGK